MSLVIKLTNFPSVPFADAQKLPPLTFWGIPPPPLSDDEGLCPSDSFPCPRLEKKKLRLETIASTREK